MTDHPRDRAPATRRVLVRDASGWTSRVVAASAAGSSGSSNADNQTSSLAVSFALIRPRDLTLGEARHRGEDGDGAIDGAIGRCAVARAGSKTVVLEPLVACGTCERCLSGLSPHCARRRVLGIAGREGAACDRLAWPNGALIDVPKDLAAAHAVFASCVGDAMHVARSIPLSKSTYVSVIGDGIDAVLAAQFMAQRNASVRLLTSRAFAARASERRGIRHRPLDDVGDRGDQDVVVDCTDGRDVEALDRCAGLLRPRGTLLVPAGHRGRPSAAWIAQSELVVRGAFLGRARDGLEAIRTGLEIDDLLPTPVAWNQAPAALDALEQRAIPDGAVPAVLIRTSD